MKKSVKLGAIVLSLGIGASLLSACSSDDLAQLGNINTSNYTVNSSSNDNSDTSLIDTSTSIDLNNISNDSTNTDTTSTDSSQPPVMVNGRNISMGMSIQDVENVLGEPYDDNKTTVTGDVSDQLVYRNMMGEQEYYLYFDNGVLNSIQDEN